MDLHKKRFASLSETSGGEFSPIAQLISPQEATSNPPYDVTYIGTSGDDRFGGSSLREYVDMGGGNDFVFASGGDDYIIGGTGNDDLHGGTGGSDIYVYAYGDGNDIIYEGVVAADPNVEADRIVFEDIASSNVKIRRTDDENYTILILDPVNRSQVGQIAIIQGAINQDGTVVGVEFFDFTDVTWTMEDIHKQYLLDVVTPFRDLIYGLAISDTVSSESGPDRIFTYAGDDRIFSGDGDDYVEAGEGDDVVYGGAGDDLIYGGLGADVIFGDAGNDTLYSLNVPFTGPYNPDGAANRLYGGAGDDHFYGEDNDVLSGGSGNDSFHSFGDGSFINGGEGIDSVDYGAYDSVSINLANRTAVMRDGDREYFQSIINVEIILPSRNGDDVMIGDAGDNIFVEGSGEDFYDGGDGFDIVDYSYDLIPFTLSPDVFIEANLNTGQVYFRTTFDDFVSFDRLVNIEGIIGTPGNDRINGADGSDDRLEGRDGNDIFKGNGGNDSLIGEGGDDLFISGFGADVHDGGDGIDTVSYQSAGAGVIVSLFANTGLLNHAAGDRFDGIENLTGSSFADYLAGDGQSNQIIGGSGNDVLVGRDGDDELTGGVGADRFVFREDFDTDTITDFTDGDDVIDLTSFGFSNFAQVSALTSQSGNDTVIDFGNGDALRLVDFDVADFDANDVMI